MKAIKMVFIIAISLVLVFAAVGCSGIAADKEVASVDGEKITVQEFEFFLQSVKSQMESEAKPEEVEKLWDTEEAVKAAKDKALEEVVKYKVQLKKAKELGLSLTEQEKEEVVEQKKSYVDYIGGRENYKKQLDEMKLSDKSFTTLLENYKLTEKLFNKITSEGTEYNISEQEIKEYYEKNKEDFKQEKVKAKHILFSTVDDSGQPLPEDKQNEAEKKAEEIYEKIKNGEDFDQLMNEYSQDPGLQTNPDGYTFGRGEMVPEFEQTAYALKPGEVSEIVKTDFGYHIIKVLDKFVDYYPLDQVKEYLKRIIINEKYNRQIEVWREQMDIQTNHEVIKQIEIK